MARPEPWMRFFARMLDLFLFGFVVGIATEIVFPGAMDTFPLNQRAGFYVLVSILWLFVEPIFLATLGSTIGKRMFNISIRKKSGHKIGFFEAQVRSFRVCVIGLGIGLPIVTVFTQIVAYRRLMANGETSWDKNGDFIVSHGEISAGRLLVLTTILLANLAAALFSILIEN